MCCLRRLLWLLDVLLWTWGYMVWTHGGKSGSLCSNRALSLFLYPFLSAPRFADKYEHLVVRIVSVLCDALDDGAPLTTQYGGIIGESWRPLRWPHHLTHRSGCLSVCLPCPCGLSTSRISTFDKQL